MTRKTRVAQCDAGTASKSGTHIMFEDGTWHRRSDINWGDQDRLDSLTRMLKLGMSAKEIAIEFGDVSRSGVIGAVKRLTDNGKLTEGFHNRPSQRGDGIRRRPRREPSPGVERAKRIKNLQHETKQVDALDHNGHPTKIEVVEWKTQPALQEFNDARLKFAKPLIECTGCKWPVRDTPSYLMCNKTVWKEGQSYCATHANWSAPTSIVDRAPNRQNASFLSPWNITSKKY